MLATVSPARTLWKMRRTTAAVIIKDQSRIGRDVVEVGLLKRTFDEYHVRFIAANVADSGR